MMAEAHVAPKPQHVNLVTPTGFEPTSGGRDGSQTRISRERVHYPYATPRSAPLAPPAMQHGMASVVGRQGLRVVLVT